MNVSLTDRVERFLTRPWYENRRALTSLLSRSMAKFLFVTRLEPGFWWIAWKDVIRNEVLDGTFEAAERRFVERFLQPGMTAVDIGAYYGLYTLIASVAVGSQGRVVAFEPSPYQMKRLRWHLRLNRSRNVRAEDVALGRVEGEGTFFSVPGGAAGFSSLRRPDVGAEVRPILVRIMTLDSYLRQHSVGTIDLIKIDVEGGEMDVFRGAENLLRQELRPVILCELQDVRTEAWGHKARDTAAFIESFGFRWFRPLSDGSLVSSLEDTGGSERNFVAIPPERMGRIKEMIKDGSRS
jgi:FkbM family methyltransferase